jgi:hypothetical protein
MPKEINFNKTSIKQLPTDKPILYKIKTERGNVNYAGIAKRGNAVKRLNEHLGNIPGATVSVEQFSSIKDARAKEKNVIKRNQPKYNTQDK